MDIDLNALRDGPRVLGLESYSTKLQGQRVSRLHHHSGKTMSQAEKPRPWEGGWR